MSREVGSLPRSAPETQGVRAQTITAFLDGIETAGLELHSFMMVRHGHVIAQGWWRPFAPNTPHMLFSLSKSFTSTAVGLAVSEGRLGLDDHVVSFFPDEAPVEPSAHLAAMRVRHLLTMASGHAVEPSLRAEGADENWVRTFLAAPVDFEPGTHFVYNSGATYMLSAIVQKVTGEDLLAYLSPRLLTPLGISDPTWERSPQGICTGGWGLNIRTEDIAKFGQLYLQKGAWQGQQLIPESWVQEATAWQIANDDGKSEEERLGSDWAQGYGYQFWRCREGAYRGDGAFGQYCIVMPGQDAVIAITSGVKDMQAVLAAVWRHLLPACEARPLAVDLVSQQALVGRLSDLRLKPPAFGKTSPLEALLLARTYVMTRTPDEHTPVHAISLSFDREECVMTLTDDFGEHPIRCGREAWLEGETTFTQGMGHARKVAASVSWRDEQTLEITGCFFETPFTFTWICSFDKEEIVLKQSVNVSFGPTELPLMRGIRQH